MRKLAALILFSTMALGFVTPVNTAPVSFSFDPVEVINSSVNELHVAFNPPEPEFGEETLLDGQTYDTIHVEGSGSPHPGEPNVPVFGRWILIPNGTYPGFIEIYPGDPSEIEAPPDFLLNPVQHTWPDVEEPIVDPFVMDEEIYSNDNDYPGIFASLGETQVLRGQEMTSLWRRRENLRLPRPGCKGGV